jgi:hypothetical protein
LLLGFVVRSSARLAGSGRAKAEKTSIFRAIRAIAMAEAPHFC